MAQLIPVQLVTSSDFSEEVELGGELFKLRMKWNVRSDSGHLDVTDINDDSVYGVKVVPNWPLLRQIKGSIEFTGDLMVLQDTELDTSEITYDNFGAGFSLYYLTQDEVNLWEDANGSG